MDYYYNLKANFLDNNFYFFEWNKNDLIVTLKKVPLFLISKEDFKLMYAHKIVINSYFVNLIKNKTISGKNENYCALFCDKNNTLLMCFDKNGKEKYRSSLTFSDDENVCEMAYALKKTKIEFKTINHIEYLNYSRNLKLINQLLSKQIDNLFLQKKYDLLLFLYSELYDDLNDDLNYVVKKIKEKINYNMNINEYKLFNDICNKKHCINK